MTIIKKICAVLPLSLPAGSNLALRTHFRGSKLEYPMIMIIVMRIILIFVMIIIENTMTLIIVMRIILIIVMIIIDNQVGYHDDYDCCYDGGDNTR